jgi:hypothetical protein
MRHAIAAVLLAMVIWLVSCREAVEVVLPAPHSLAPQPDQDEALRIVWSETYRMPGKAPGVDWRTGAALDCAGGSAFLDDGGCYDGRYYTGADYVIVGRWDGATLAETALAHELAHAAQWARDGEADHDHAGPWFAPGGPMERAEEALRQAWPTAPARALAAAQPLEPRRSARLRAQDLVLVR